MACLGWAGLVSLAGCQRSNQFVEPPPPKVTVAVPVREPVQEYFYTTGQTRAVASVELRARVGGYLQKILFKDGDLVEKDQMLFQIDPAPYQAQLDSAKAALERAEAQLVLAERQLNRTRLLARENAATESNLDIQEAERASALANVAGAKAALREAQLNLDYTEIRAPFAGRIGRHLVDLGNLITAGTTLLASLETVDPIYAYFTLSETDLLRFMEMQKTGELQSISDSDPPQFDMALGSSEQFLYHGKLDFREFGIDPATGTTERRAVFPNTDVTLVPGLFCRLRAAVGPPREQLMVDERAVGTDQRGKFLLVVSSKNEVELRMVKLGGVQNGMRAILSGIQPDDHVVINGLQRARPGGTVNPELVPMRKRLENPPPSKKNTSPASQPETPMDQTAPEKAHPEKAGSEKPGPEPQAAPAAAGEDARQSQTSKPAAQTAGNRNRLGW
jgi:RND family efflux transporter MFP subunit